MIKLVLKLYYLKILYFSKIVNKEYYCKQKKLYRDNIALLKENEKKFWQQVKNTPYNKRFLLIAHDFSISGSSIALYNLAKILKSSGYSVFCISDDNSGKYRKNYVNKHIPSLYNKINEDFIEKISLNFKYCLCNTFKNADIAIKLQEKIISILYLHEGLDILENYDLSSAQIGEKLDKVNNIISVSEHARAFLETISKTNIYVCNNSVEDYKFKNHTYTKNSKIKFLVAGRLTKTKGIEEVCEAFNLLGNNINAELHIIGMKSDFSKSIANKYKKNESIYWYNLIKDIKKKYRFFLDNDVFIVPSYDESSSLVTIEGAMLAKPLIVTNNVGARYLIENQLNGFIVTTKSVEELKEKMKWFIAHPDKINEMGRISREKYLSTSTIDIYEQNILKILGDITKNESN